MCFSFYNPNVCVNGVYFDFQLQRHKTISSHLFQTMTRTKSKNSTWSIGNYGKRTSIESLLLLSHCIQIRNQYRTRYHCISCVGGIHQRTLARVAVICSCHRKVDGRRNYTGNGCDKHQITWRFGILDNLRHNNNQA